MPVRIPLIENLKINEITGCWNFKGTKAGPMGYGQMSYAGKKEYVHRVAAHIWKRFDLTSDKSVLHHCDNPTCFNPKHLFIGTLSENIYDCVKKGRHVQARKTHCQRGHLLSPDNLKPYDLRVRNFRRCLTCDRENAKRYRDESLR